MKTPEGYVLVPVEPTQAMLDAAQEAFPRSASFVFPKLYAAMLSAAPTDKALVKGGKPDEVKAAAHNVAERLQNYPHPATDEWREVKVKVRDAHTLVRGALVEEGGLREALERARRLPVIVEEMIELEMLDREEDRPQLEQYRQDRIQTLRLIGAALSALSTKDMGLSRDLSQTADAATPKSAATEQVKP